MIERLAPATVAPATAPPPRHVAIIMDGNRRWASERGLAPLEGDVAGAAALGRTVDAAAAAGVTILTVYAFSQQSGRELVRHFATSEYEALAASDVRVRILGRTHALPPEVAAPVAHVVSGTQRCSGMLLNLALDYGARAELCDAVRALAVDVRRGSLALDAIDDDSIAAYLYTAGLPDPDLLIRTGGELRSNFLLYQIAYAELWSTPVPWPAFERQHFARALADFANRQRRFGS